MPSRTTSSPAAKTAQAIKPDRAIKAADTPPRRSPGRPGRRASAALPDDLRARMLDAAMELFAEQGVAGTSLNSIAKAVGVTPALVHYYFRNRESLVDAVADERLLPIVTAVWSSVDDGDDPLAMAERIARQLISVAEKNPSFPMLWAREIVHEKGELRERLFRALPHDKIARFADAIRARQKNGRIHPDLEPYFFAVSLMGLTLLPLATASIWRRLPGLKRFSRERLARHVMALVQCGIGEPSAMGNKAKAAARKRTRTQ